MGIVGVWVTVLGYALAYTGVGHFQGNPNAGFLASLGYGPTAAQQAAAAAQATSPLSIFGNILGNVLNPGGALWQLISGGGQNIVTPTAATTTTPSSSAAGTLLV